MAPNESIKGSGRFRKWLRRQPQQEPVTEQPQVLLPDLQRPTELERHRKIVAQEVLRLFNLADAKVAQIIGFGGNIRDEIFRRRPQTTRDSLDITGIDPALAPYVNRGRFFFRADDTSGDPVAMYEIDYDGGSFRPKLELVRQKSRIAISVFTGPNRNDYSSVQIRKTQHKGGWRQITTFYPHYLAKGPDHPIRVDTSNGTHAIYNNIDPEGNVTLLHGQPITLEFITGIYSAKDHSITPDRGEPYYGTVTDTDIVQFTDRYGGKQSIPRRTNLYNEIRALVHDASFPQLPS